MPRHAPAHAAGLQPRTVQERLDGLRTALAVGEGRLDPDAAKHARDVLDRVGERLRLGADLTVVALVGATGSGKSSLFNALAELDVAEVGVRRPTTGHATACVWAEDAGPLLDWLGVPEHLRTDRQTVLDAHRQSDLHGLVLLDLPDHDSTTLSHRLEVDRLVELVDLMVWVVDPQKYADEALHAGYLQRLGEHEAVMVVVLNQVDRLTPPEAHACATDLRRLLDSDGLTSVTMLTTSVPLGTGIPELRAMLSRLVAGHGAFTSRISADLAQVVGELRPGIADTEPDPARLPGSDQLVSALAQSAGLHAILDVITGQYQREARARTTWPPVAWWNRLRPDAVTRLGLAEDDAEQLRELSRPEAPAITPAQRSQVEQAARSVTDATARALPPRWGDAVAAAAAEPAEDLGQVLDDAVRSVDLTLRRPVWWTMVHLLHRALLAVTALGVLWLLGLGVARAVGRSPESGPSFGPLPLPALLALAGVLLGVLLVVAVRWATQAGATHRRDHVAARLRAAVSVVAVDQVIAPVAAVVADHRTVREALGG